MRADFFQRTDNLSYVPVKDNCSKLPECFWSVIEQTASMERQKTFFRAANWKPAAANTANLTNPSSQVDIHLTSLCFSNMKIFLLNVPHDEENAHPNGNVLVSEEQKKRDKQQYCVRNCFCARELCSYLVSGVNFKKKKNMQICLATITGISARNGTFSRSIGCLKDNTQACVSQQKQAALRHESCCERHEGEGRTMQQSSKV